MGKGNFKKLLKNLNIIYIIFLLVLMKKYNLFG